jgi:cholesterol transport system auxiliary component
MLRAAIVILGIAILCIGVGGCSLFPPEIKVEKAVLNPLPTELPHGDNHAGTVLVFPPEAASIYDTTQMAYRPQAHGVAYFREREWGEKPSQMLHPLLVKALEKTGAFEAVLVPPYTGRYTYALRTQILELIQDFTSQPATLSLSLRFQLTDYGARHMVATREVSLREPMREGTSYAGVIAANDATVRALQQMASFVLEQTH